MRFKLYGIISQKTTTRVPEIISHKPFEKSFELLRFKVTSKDTGSIASIKFLKELSKASTEYLFVPEEAHSGKIST